MPDRLLVPELDGVPLAEPLLLLVPVLEGTELAVMEPDLEGVMVFVGVIDFDGVPLGVGERERVPLVVPLCVAVAAPPGVLDLVGLREVVPDLLGLRVREREGEALGEGDLVAGEGVPLGLRDLVGEKEGVRDLVGVKEGVTEGVRLREGVLLRVPVGERVLERVGEKVTCRRRAPLLPNPPPPASSSSSRRREPATCDA